MPGLEIFCRAGVIFPEAGTGDFFAGAGDFFARAGAGAGGEKPGVCTALDQLNRVQACQQPCSSWPAQPCSSLFNRQIQAVHFYLCTISTGLSHLNFVQAVYRACRLVGAHD